ncbi:MAG: hypothetical protein KDB69_05585 [Acidimicrobiia bacterium]|nr:hypothetical protein [Acidimicrobiia bacterium]
MARYALIDGYLDAMRAGLNGRRDLDDLVCEMEDHLYSTVEGLCSRGSTPAKAERTALERFGDPDTVATVYASSKHGGVAMPTDFTRRAGTFAIVSAGLLALFGAYWIVWSEFLDSRFEWEGWGSSLYMVATFVLMAGFLCMTVAAVGIIQRTGTKGLLPIVAFVFLGLGTVSTLLAWFVGAWMLMGGIGALCTSIILLRSGLGSTAHALLFGLGLPTGLVTFVAFRVAEFGRVDEWGDYPTATTIGVGVGCFMTAVGLVGVGRWLRSEDPIDIERTPIAA